MTNSVLDDHRDQRGYVVNPFEHLKDTGEISNCHAFSIEPGHSRGNHTHETRNEQVLVLAGSVQITAGDEQTTLTAETPSILTIKEGVNHTFHNKGDSTAVVICWSSERSSN